MKAVSKGIFAVLLGVVAVVVGVLNVSTESYAADTPTKQTITVSPASLSVEVDPGQSIERRIYVTNTGTDPYDLGVSAVPYSVKGQLYEPELRPIQGATDVSSWVDVSVNEMRLENNSGVDIDVTVSVPGNAVAGGYYVAILAQASPIESTGSLTRYGRVGVVLYITVNGEIKKSGNIRSVDIPTLILQPQVSVRSVVENTGGVHFMSDAEFRVADIFGKEVFKEKVSRYVLPQTEREIGVTWVPNANIGVYVIERSATINGESRSLPAKIVVIAQPWFVLTVSVLILLIGLLVIVSTVRRQHAKKQQVEKDGSDKVS